MGNYHQASLKHLPRYATEFKWRHNHRPETVRERMESIVRNMRHRRMTLKEMRAGGKSAEVKEEELRFHALLQELSSSHRTVETLSKALPAGPHAEPARLRWWPFRRPR